MSQTSIQNFPLSHLDFKSELSKEVIKSTTLETILEQHEQTLTRLKVSLRRQSRLEDEIEQSKKLIESFQKQINDQQDFKSIELEKQQLLAEKIIALQNENAELSKKLNYQNYDLEKLQANQIRHEKYHEKIKVQVRPYIEQLKIFSSQLDQKNKKLEAQISLIEVQKSEMQTQMAELVENLKLQVKTHTQKEEELIQSYEAEIQYASSVVKDLQMQIDDLMDKNKKLNQSYEIQIELENKLIETQRLYENQKQNFEEEILRLQSAYKDSSQANSRLQLEKDDYQHRIILDTQHIESLQIKNAELSTQLESLRYMWNAKNEEAERLKISIESLEKLNLELSSKIQETRQQQITQSR